MKNKIIKITSLILVLLLISSLFVGCEEKLDTKNAIKLSFKSASGYDYLKSIDGKTVTINGYMATSSPVDGSFMFLMNLPYQSCPFCVPNTTQLSNTMEVYPKKGDSFDYTAQAIKIVGKLVVADDPDEPFTDKYGYKFNFKIVDATYTIIPSDELSEDLVLWQKIAESDIVNDLYKMYDYVNFVCAWNTYFVNSYTDSNGNIVTGYYLYASDAEKFIKNEGAQYNYGYKEGYFDSLINKIEKIDPNAFSDLVSNIRAAEQLASDALYELDNENYTYELIYVEKFGTEDYVYTLNKGEELSSEMERIYSEFANWIASWEM